MLEQRKILQSVSMSLKHLKLSLFSFNSGTNLFDDPLASLYSKTTGQLHIETAVNWSSWSFCWEASEFEAKVLLFLFKHEASHLFFESSSNTREIPTFAPFPVYTFSHKVAHTVVSLSADPRYTCKMLHSETIWYAILASARCFQSPFGTSPSGLQFHRILHFYGIFDYINHNTSTTQCRYTVYTYIPYIPWEHLG